MVLEIIGASVMIAFGVLAIFFSIDSGVNDMKMFIIMIIGLMLMIGGGWIIVTSISLAVLLAKIAGILLIALGFFMLTGFPDLYEYQTREMTKAGVFLGVIFFVVGFYLLLFFA